MNPAPPPMQARRGGLPSLPPPLEGSAIAAMVCAVSRDFFWVGKMGAAVMSIEY